MSAVSGCLREGTGRAAHVAEAGGATERQRRQRLTAPRGTACVKIVCSVPLNTDADQPVPKVFSAGGSSAASSEGPASSRCLVTAYSVEVSIPSLNNAAAPCRPGRRPALAGGI